jgi:putative transposase
VSTVESLKEHMPLTRACNIIGVPRASVYRARQAVRGFVGPRQPYRPERALSEAERDHIRAVLNSSEYMDLPPRAAYAKLLEKGKYLCSWRTMYRILAEHGEVRERRAVRPRRSFVRPELVAMAPRKVWTWDITKLKGASKGQLFYLYVILDIFSRYVVGWLVAEREGEDLARQLVRETSAKEGIQPDTLVLHADRGSPMIAGSMGELLVELGITKSHSRPRVSNDNPYSEAQFKTVKYRPAFPGRFQGRDHVHGWARETFTWYNHHHYHSALALLTPAIVHAGQAEAVLADRQQTLDAAYEAHPERFPNGRPRAGSLPEKVWINEPAVAVQADPVPIAPAPEAPLPDHQPSAQPGSRADAPPLARPAQRTLDAGEHSAIPTTAAIPAMAPAQ